MVTATETSVNVQIIGKHIDLGDALRARIEDELDAAVTKYFDRPTDGHVTVSKDGHLITVDATVHLPSGIVLQSSGKASEPHAALDDAVFKMQKRVRRYHRRLKDHHREDRVPLPSESAASYVIQSTYDPVEEDTAKENGSDHAPLIVAETSEEIKTMSVSEAVMQLEVGEAPAVLFRNAGHEGLNMVYLRADGNIGWVNPGAVSAKS